MCSSECEEFGVFCGLFSVPCALSKFDLLEMHCTKHCLDALSELIHQHTLLSCALRCETFLVAYSVPCALHYAVVGRFDL